MPHPNHKTISNGKTITHQGNKFSIITKPGDIEIRQYVSPGTWRYVSKQHPHYAALRRKGVKAVNERQRQIGLVTDKTITMSFDQAAGLKEPKPGFAQTTMARVAETFQERREANRGRTARREPHPKELDPHAFTEAIHKITGRTTLWEKLDWKQQKRVLDFLKKEGYDVRKFEKERKKKPNKRKLSREDVENAIIKVIGIQVSWENFGNLAPETKNAVIEHLAEQRFDVSELRKK